MANSSLGRKDLRLQSPGDFIQWWRAVEGPEPWAGPAGLRHTMQNGLQERRTMRRFDMRLPAIIQIDGADEFNTETQNVSARGVYFYLDRALAAGTQLQVTLTFPPHVTLTDAVRVRFTARVIRVEHQQPTLRIGTAAMIEGYEFLRASETVTALLQ